MLYEVGAIPRDNQAMYEEIFCFLAKLIFKEHHQEFMILGIISMSGDNYLLHNSLFECRLPIHSF
jgi:hypothetical protein